MKRREFFKSATVLTAGSAVAALAAPAIAQSNVTWRMVTTWPKNFPGLGVGAQKLADRITKASGGRLTVQVFAAGEMVPPLGALAQNQLIGNCQLTQQRGQALPRLARLPS